MFYNFDLVGVYLKKILFYFSKRMPVGCLGGGSGNGSHGGGGGGGGPRGQQQQPDLEVIVTSSILNSADQFAFMQQTLLMQIFRITTPTTVSQNLSVISKSGTLYFTIMQIYVKSQNQALLTTRKKNS